MAPMALANLQLIQLHLFNGTHEDAMDALYKRHIGAMDALGTQGMSRSPCSSCSPDEANFFAWGLHWLTPIVKSNG